MSIELPNGRAAFLPQVPQSISDKKLKEYLQMLVNDMEDRLNKQFDNTYHIISTGTTGTFIQSSGGTITVTNGLITGIS